LSFATRFSPRKRTLVLVALISVFTLVIISYLALNSSDAVAMGLDLFSKFIQSFVDLASLPVVNLFSLFRIAISREIAAMVMVSILFVSLFLFVRSSFTRIAMKNVPKRKLRNALTVVAIILGVALVVGVNISLDSSLIEFKQTINEAAGNVDINIRSTLNEPFNQSILETITEVKGVSNASLRISDPVQIWEPRDEEWVAATLVGVNSRSDFSYLDLDSMGQLAQLEVNGTGVVVDEGLNFTIGEILKLKIIPVNYTDYLIGQSNSSEEIEFKVVGIFQPQQIGAVQGKHTIFIDFVKAQHIFDREDKADYIIVKVAEIEKTDQVIKNLEQLGELYIISPVKENILAQMSQASTGFQYGLQIMSFLTVCVAIILILNTTYLNVGERIFEIGILRSIGSSRRQIFWMFFSESIVLGIIGVIIGLILAIPLAQTFTFLSSQISSALIPPPETFVIKPWNFILGAGIGLAASTLGGIFPSLFASRIDIIKALRPAIRKSGKSRTAIKLIGAGLPITFFSLLIFTNISEQHGSGSFSALNILALVVPFLMVGLISLTAGLLRGLNPVIERCLIFFGGNRRIIARNIGRNLLRSTICFTLIGMTLSFIIVISGAQSGVVTGLEDVIQSFYSADLTIMSETPLNKSFSMNLTLIDNGSLIDKVAPALIIPRTVMLLNNISETNSSSMIIAIDSTYPEVMSMKFTEETPPDVFLKLQENGTIILTSPLANSLNANVNDKIQMSLISIVLPENIPFTTSNVSSFNGTIPSASSYNGTYSSNISNNMAQNYTTIYKPEVQIINENFTVIGIAVGSMLEWNHGLYSSPLSEASYISYNSLGITFPDYNEVSNLFFTKIKSDRVELAQDRVKEIYGSEYLLSTMTVNDALNPARTGIDNTFTILNAIVMFAVVNAAVGVTAIMVMNISERRREIGIVRSLGMSRFQVVTSIIGEASVLAATGFAIGTIAGLILNKVTIGFMRVTGFPLPYTIPFDSIWLSLFLAFIASFISAAYPAYRVSRLKIVDSLRR